MGPRQFPRTRTDPGRGSRSRFFRNARFGCDTPAAVAAPRRPRVPLLSPAWALIGSLHIPARRFYHLLELGNREPTWDPAPFMAHPAAMHRSQHCRHVVWLQPLDSTFGHHPDGIGKPDCRFNFPGSICDLRNVLEGSRLRRKGSATDQKGVRHHRTHRRHRRGPIWLYRRVEWLGRICLGSPPSATGFTELLARGSHSDQRIVTPEFRLRRDDGWRRSDSEAL